MKYEPDHVWEIVEQLTENPTLRQLFFDWLMAENEAVGHAIVTRFAVSIRRKPPDEQPELIAEFNACFEKIPALVSNLLAKIQVVSSAGLN